MTSPKMRSIAAILFLAPFMVAQAQWSSDPSLNNSICRAGNNQKIPRLTGDGKGGAIICWSDERDGTGFYRVYVQRIDRDGYIRWPENGIPISSTYNTRLNPEIVSDDAGGAIVVWTDPRNVDLDIYAQRIDSSGNILWTADGVPVASGSRNQTDAKLVSDGQHGAIVTWSAYSVSAQDGHIYAQRIDGNGNRLWSPELTLSSSDQFESAPSIASDGSGGAYIAWAFYNNQEYDVYAQRVHANGAQQWQSGGIPLTSPSGAQDTPALVPDGTGKAFLSYYDWSSGSAPALNVVVLNADGTAAASLRVASTSGGQMHPQMANVGPGLLGIAWEDGRVAGKTRSYVQVIDNTGKTEWAANGVEVSSRSGNQATPYVVADGIGGLIVAWEDMTAGPADSDIYAQRFSAGGTPLWASAGVPLSTAGRMQQYPWMISDGENGAIATWEDYRASYANPDIYASRILADGTFPLEPPILSFSSKTVAFGAAPVGSASTKTITLTNTGGVPVTIASVTSSDAHFSLTPDSSTISPNSSVRATVRFLPSSRDTLAAAIVIESNSIFGPDTVSVSGWGTASAAIEVDRQSLNFGDVRTGSSKTLVLRISNPGNDTLTISSIATNHASFTTAIASRILPPGDAFDDTVRFSPADPGPVTGELTLTSNAPTSPTTVGLSGTGVPVVTITIDPAEVSFGDVEIGSHRDTTLTITNAGNDTLRIASFISDDVRFSLETPLEDIAPAGSGTFTLRFTPNAVGSVSSVFTVTSNAESSPDTIAVQGTGRDVTAVRPAHIVAGAFTLFPNYPNPFHPSTTIRYELEAAAPVRLTVHDALGQVVETLVDETQHAGTHSVRWISRDRTPGMHFLVLRVGTHVASRRMMLVR